jgi:hypothetical protein
LRLTFIWYRNSHRSLVAQGGYFFLVIATTIDTIVAINTASKVRAANTIDSIWYVVIAITPFRTGVSAATLDYVVVILLLHHLEKEFNRLIRTNVRNFGVQDFRI